MTREEMVHTIDGEIERLERVRVLLQESNSDKFNFTGNLARGVTARSAKASAGDKPKRVLSPEARRRIAQAQKRRWAKQKAGRA